MPIKKYIIRNYAPTHKLSEIAHRVVSIKAKGVCTSYNDLEIQWLRFFKMI